MSRFARAVDGNHRDIVRALRQLAVPVTSLASCGGGVPDLLVWSRAARRWRLVEVKDRRKVPSARRLTEAERAFFAAHGEAVELGDLVVCESVEDVLRAAGVVP